MILQIFTPGLIGLFIASFLAATIVPFSSEAIFLGTIYLGNNAIPTIIIASLGNWLGGLTSYYLGYLGKWYWLEKYFRVKKESLMRFSKKANKYGSLLAFFCWLPFIGDVIAVALGFFKTNFTLTAIYMLAGKTIRYVLWYLITFELLFN